MTGLVLREDNQGIATLTLNRPDKLNALSKDLFEELEKHIDQIARETRRTVLVILRGAGVLFLPAMIWLRWPIR
jgi:enoyl-CoA hydratase/carnithine racemase